MAIEHDSISDGERHEPKGASTASSGQVYVSDGAGSGTWQSPLQVGWWDYNDAGTSSSAIVLSPDTWTILTNDGAGANTNKTYALTGVDDVWDTSTNRFDYSGLEIGDTLNIRIDLDVTTTAANQGLGLRVVLAKGSGSEIPLQVMTEQVYRFAGTYKIIVPVLTYIGSSLTKDNPVSIEIMSDDAASVVVNGWFVKVES